MAKKPTEETPVTPVVAEENLLTEVLGSLNTTNQNASASPAPEEKGLFTAEGVLKSRH